MVDDELEPELELYIVFKNGKTDTVDPIDNPWKDVKEENGVLIVNNGNEYRYNLAEIESYNVREMK